MRVSTVFQVLAVLCAAWTLVAARDRRPWERSPKAHGSRPKRKRHPEPDHTRPQRKFRGGHVRHPMFEGNGCPTDSVVLVNASDTTSFALSALFSEFQAQTSSETLRDRRTCIITVVLEPEENMSIGVAHVDFRGSAYVPMSASGSVDSARFPHAQLRASYSLVSGDRTPIANATFSTGYDDQLYESIDVSAEAWTPCPSNGRGSRVHEFRIFAAVSAVKASASDEDVVIAIDTSDATFQKGVYYQLTTRPCGSSSVAMLAKIFRRFPSQHGDFIHDMSFDFYGTRLATCSSDRKIKIWEQVGGDWKLQYEWSAHQASVWKIAWAHPEFGQILASCSFDRTVCIWEDQGAPLHQGSSTNSAREHWRSQAQLVDSRESVHDVKFAPRHLGLRLATASEDGFVRMYEAIDVMNLAHWPLQEEFLADKEGVTCISWNQSRFDAPMIVVGGNSDVVKVWGYNNSYRRWQVVAELQGHGDAIHDVCWAPNMGRSYHLVATASKDRTVRIWKLKMQDTLQCDVEEVALKHHHDSEVWRVEWNITGTMLASSGDDGTVRLWKSDHDGNWVCLNTICGDLGVLSPSDFKGL